MPYGGRTAICSVPVGWPVMSGRRLTDIYGLSGLSKIWPGARPMCASIDRFIGDQIAMRNAAAGFKSELKVTRCPPDSHK